MAGVQAPWELIGSSPERGRRGKEERGRGHGLGVAWGAARGGGGPWALGAPFPVRAPCCCSHEFCCFVRRRREGRRKERKKKKE
jgi:hypothetical protein